MKKFSEEEQNYICSHYLSNCNIQFLSKKFNVSDYRIKTVLKNHDIQIVSRYEEIMKIRFPRNSDIFERIDSKEKAYWLGFLYADGGIVKNVLRVNLSEKDEAHLYKLKQFLECSRHEIKHNDKTVGEKTFPIVYLSLGDKKLISDLERLGCVPRKSLILKFPTSSQVPREFLSHFIRGYFDGDGSVSVYKKKNRIQISFTGTFNFLESLKTELKNPMLKIENKEKFGVLHFDGKEQVYSIYKYLYQNSYSDIELERKKKIFQDYYNI